MFLPVTLQLLEGFGETLKVFLLTLAFSLPLGLLVCFGSMSKFTPLKALIRCFVWIIRGTPLMLQLIIIFYGPGLLFDLPALLLFLRDLSGRYREHLARAIRSRTGTGAKKRTGFLPHRPPPGRQAGNGTYEQ